MGPGSFEPGWRTAAARRRNSGSTLQWGRVPSNPDGGERSMRLIGTAASLQWGRVPSNPDGRRARRGVAQAHHASMGPGSFEPGWFDLCLTHDMTDVASMGPGSFEPGWSMTWLVFRRVARGFNGAGFLRTRMAAARPGSASSA